MCRRCGPCRLRERHIRSARRRASPSRPVGPTPWTRTKSEKILPLLVHEECAEDAVHVAYGNDISAQHGVAHHHLGLLVPLRGPELNPRRFCPSLYMRNVPKMRSMSLTGTTYPLSTASRITISACWSHSVDQN